MGCVYVATNRVNGKQYVGKTKGKLSRRKFEHENNARNGFDSCFYDAIRKYGSDAFEWKVLTREDNPDYLNEDEVFYIKVLKTKVPNGYNMTDGGDGQSTMPKQTRLKISRSCKGRRHSPETIEKIRAGNIGKHKSTPALRSVLIRRNKSTEHRLKVSAAHKANGVQPSAEATRKGGLSLKGIKQSPELVEKRAASLRGKKKSEEHKRKISEALRKSK